MDADFSHPIASLTELFGHARDHDLVLGSRYLDGITVVRWPIERLLISYFGNYYVRKLTRLPVSDTTGGFKCWRREALEALPLDRIRTKGYAFQIETTYRALQAGFEVEEVPIVFAERRSGGSKMTRGIVLEAMWKVPELRLRSARNHL